MSKVALLTSNHQRHLWVANQISKSSDLCCVISERKRKAVESKDSCHDQIISQYLKFKFGTVQISKFHINLTCCSL